MTAHFVPTIDRLVIARPLETVGSRGEFQGQTREVGPRAEGMGAPVLVAGLCMMIL